MADKLTEFAQFFSFGANDLTQMTFGFSRDDAGKFLMPYLEKKSWRPTRSRRLTRWVPAR